MKTWSCLCGNRLHFENTQCLACGRPVAFLPPLLCMAALEALPAPQENRFRALLPQLPAQHYRACRNGSDYAACNWLVREGDAQALCVSCRLNRVIPNLASARNLRLWQRIEAAKRRLVYSLLQLRLPLGSDQHSPGLAFRILEPGAPVPDAQPAAAAHVLTGHDDGVVTINLDEADHTAREQIREQMNEAYRTLLGHFRHESGHYYWERLVRHGGWVGPFRALFGDERENYDAALARYYREGPPAGWQERFISAYATVHPWEDWAETWTHYLHMSDTLETARDCGVVLAGRASRAASDFDALYGDWLQLASTMNAINRSMGLVDAYPFTPTPIPIAKLRFIHVLLQQRSAGG